MNIEELKEHRKTLNDTLYNIYEEHSQSLRERSLPLEKELSAVSYKIDCLEQEQALKEGLDAVDDPAAAIFDLMKEASAAINKAVKIKQAFSEATKGVVPVISVSDMPNLYYGGWAHRTWDEEISFSDKGWYPSYSTDPVL